MLSDSHTVPGALSQVTLIQQVHRTRATQQRPSQTPAPALWSIQ